MSEMEINGTTFVINESVVPAMLDVLRPMANEGDGLASARFVIKASYSQDLKNLVLVDATPKRSLKSREIATSQTTDGAGVVAGVIQVINGIGQLVSGNRAVGVEFVLSGIFTFGLAIKSTILNRLKSV